MWRTMRVNLVARRQKQTVSSAKSGLARATTGRRSTSRKPTSRNPRRSKRSWLGDSAAILAGSASNNCHDSNRTAATPTNAGSCRPRGNPRNRRPGHAALRPRRARGPLSHAAWNDPRPRHASAARLPALLRMRRRSDARTAGLPAARGRCDRQRSFSDYRSHRRRLARKSRKTGLLALLALGIALTRAHRQAHSTITKFHRCRSPSVRDGMPPSRARDAGNYAGHQRLGRSRSEISNSIFSGAQHRFRSGVGVQLRSGRRNNPFHGSHHPEMPPATKILLAPAKSRDAESGSLEAKRKRSAHSASRFRHERCWRRFLQRWWRIQHQTQRPIPCREKINRISREKHDRRNRDQRDQIEKSGQQNASHDYSKSNGKDVPSKARRFARQHGNNPQARGGNGDDQTKDQRRDADDDSGANRQHDFHAHIHGITALFRLNHAPQAPPTLDRANLFQRHLRHDKILGQHVNHRRNQEKKEHQEDHNDPAQYQRQDVFARRMKPSAGKRESGGDSQQHRHSSEGRQHQSQLPAKIFPRRALPAIPPLPDVTFFREHAVEQNEPHHAAHVHHHNKKDETSHHENRDESAENCGIDFRPTLLQEVARRSRLMRKARRKVNTSA